MIIHYQAEEEATVVHDQLNTQAVKRASNASKTVWCQTPHMPDDVGNLSARMIQILIVLYFLQ